MKIQSSIWKNRTINLPNHSGAKFDNEGVCNIDVPAAEIEYLIANVTGITAVENEGTAKAPKEKKKEAVIEGTAPLANAKAIEDNQTALTDEQAKEKAALEKKEAIEKINSLTKVAQLKELASSFPEAEWINLKKVIDLKNYLISKV